VSCVGRALEVCSRSSNPVVSLAIPNDVYLSYSIFMLTSTMRTVVLPLTPQTDIPFTQKSKSAPITPQKASAIGSKGQLPPTPTPSSATNTDKPKAWLSSSEFDPYIVPSIFSQPLGLPTNPRLALPASQSKSEFVLTPDTMRYLGQTVEHLRAQMDSVKYANTMADAQVQIQTMEFHRQVRQVQQILVMLETSRTKRSAAWKERVEKVRKTQDELLERLDRALRIYMRKVAPELSEQETKWFEELKRMKAEVLGQGKYDEQSLRARTKLVSTTGDLFDRPFSSSFEQFLPSYNGSMTASCLSSKNSARRNRSGDPSRTVRTRDLELPRRSSTVNDLLKRRYGWRIWRSRFWRWLKS
jgi:nucleoporin NUP82